MILKLIPRTIARLAVRIVTPLGLMGYGLWLIYPPAAFATVGLLMWIDLSVGELIASLKKPRK